MSQPNTGDSKRFCTLNVSFSPSGQQARLAIIFRGKGKRLNALKKATWDKDADGFFQPNAWADTDFYFDWCKETLEPPVQGTERFLLFLDNPEAHIQESFRNSVKDLGGISWFGVPGATDICQPVDGGYCSTLRRLINQDFFDWLDDDENLGQGYGADSHITTSENRVLIRNWAGNVYRKLTQSSYDGFRLRLFEKTSCLITADGSEDNTTNPESLPD